MLHRTESEEINVMPYNRISPRTITLQEISYYFRKSSQSEYQGCV